MIGPCRILVFLHHFRQAADSRSGGNASCPGSLKVQLNLKQKNIRKLSWQNRSGSHYLNCPSCSCSTNAYRNRKKASVSEHQKRWHSFSSGLFQNKSPGHRVMIAVLEVQIVSGHIDDCDIRRDEEAVDDREEGNPWPIRAVQRADGRRARVYRPLKPSRSEGIGEGLQPLRPFLLRGKAAVVGSRQGVVPIAADDEIVVLLHFLLNIVLQKIKLLFADGAALVEGR